MSRRSRAATAGRRSSCQPFSHPLSHSRTCPTVATVTDGVGTRPAVAGHRRFRWLRAVPALALACAVVPSWLSGSGSGSTSAPYALASSTEPSPEPSPSPSPTESPSPSLPSCETSPGMVTLPDPLPSGWSVPGWVSFSASGRCALLDVSSLRDIPEPVDPAPEPSNLPESQQLGQIHEELQGLRSLVLYAAGLLIFCSAGIFWRSRR